MPKIDFSFVAAAFVCLAVLSGCAAPKVIARGRIVEMVQPELESIDSEDQAREAFLALRDQGVFPHIGVAEVEVTIVGITLRGPNKTFTTWASAGFGSGSAQMYGKNLVADQSTYSSGSVVKEEKKQSLNVWFKDIRFISVSEVEETLGLAANGDDLTGFEPGITGYECEIEVEERGSIRFVAKSRTYALRLAQAFAFKSPKAEWKVTTFPPCGAVANDATGMIIRMKKNGLFHKAGIPVLSSVVQVDSKEVKPQDLNLVLGDLAPGIHTLNYHPPTPWVFQFETKKFEIKYQ